MGAASAVRLSELYPTPEVRLTREPLRSTRTGDASFGSRLDAVRKKSEGASTDEDEDEQKRSSGGGTGLAVAVISEAQRPYIDKLRIEIANAQRIFASMPGINSQLEKQLTQEKARLAERMELDRLNPATGLDAAKLRMEMSHVLQMQYLAIENKFTYPRTGTISNLMKKRSDSIRDVIKGASGG